MTLSSTAIAAINASETAEIFVMLLTITEASLDQPARVTNAGADIVSRGETYLDRPFTIALPAQGANNLPRVELRIDAIDQTLVRALEAATPPVLAVLEVILASDPDVIEVGPIPVELYNADWDVTDMQAELGMDRILDAPFPAHSINPGDYPGVF